MLRKGFRPVSMPRHLAEVIIEFMREDRSAFETFGDLCVQPLKDFMRTIKVAVAKGGDPVEFWCTQVQETTVTSALSHGFLFGKKPTGMSKEILREAHDVLSAAWTPPPRPELPERERLDWMGVTPPVPSDEQIAACGFRDLDHLRQAYPYDTIKMVRHESRAQLETFYMEGWCAVLGEAIHKRMGWPVVGIFKPWEEKIIIHVACKAPDGTYVDARGMGQTREQLCAPYEDWPDCPLDVREVTLEHLHELFKRHPYYHEVALNEHLDLLLPELSPELTPVP